MRESSGVWRQNRLSIQLSDAGNGEAQIACLHNEAYGVYRKETPKNQGLPVQIKVEEALLAL